MKNMQWDAYQIFLAVARGGGLTGAAATTGFSPATLGRRMLELEHDTGRVLFVRRQTGYALTGDGRLLFDQLQEMEAAVRKVETWQQEISAPVLVRIAAGTWNAGLLSENFTALCSEKDNFRIDLFIAERRASLSHRGSDIGLRAFRPEEPNLAAVKAGTVAYAAYRLKGLNEAARDRWIAVSEEDAVSAYLRWPYETVAGRITVTVNRPRSLHDLVLAGAGTAVLPCFVGDRNARLERAGDDIPALRHEQWIVMNNEDRHRREIRTVIDRMTRLMKGHADLFAGKRPGPGL